MDRIVPVSYDFKNGGEIRKFVLECENRFLRQVDDAADKIIISQKKYIALSGPTCSGKTTASQRILHEFASRGIRVKTVSIDDFYYSRALLEKRAAESGTPIDFDSPSTVDMELFAACAAKLKAGEVAELPHYDFMTGECDSVTPFSGKDADLFLFEGIQAIYPQVTEILGKEDTVSVSIRPRDAIKAGGEIFESHELRFARRMVRDFRFRNALPEYTFLLWESVRANEKAYIEPYEKNADILINSTMLYEPAMIRDDLLHDLALVPKTSKYYEEAMRLAATYAGIPSLPTAFIPDQSIFREFIGQEGT